MLGPMSHLELIGFNTLPPVLLSVLWSIAGRCLRTKNRSGSSGNDRESGGCHGESSGYGSDDEVFGGNGSR